jgi:hypothetical protein
VPLPTAKAKIRGIVSTSFQQICDNVGVPDQQKREAEMYQPDEMYANDHGLPLVQLKERRRELVAALQNRTGPVTDEELRKIAAIQQSIAAFEDVIADLDGEESCTTNAGSDRWAHSFPLFGRRQGLVEFQH